jgi:hypothetical protein
MLDILIKEKDQRETWYYPESAYWVTFDSSIPLFLLPYLSARLEDIQLMDSLQIPGHLTFSSGWEWGYWLFDWSIARWSWKHHYKNKLRQSQKEKPSMFIADLLGKDSITAFFEENLKLQNEYLKDKELMRYMTAMTVTDEIPEKYALEFHPRPEISYKKLAKHADSATVAEVAERWLPLLDEFSSKTLKSVEKLQAYLEKQEKSIARKRGPFLDSQKERILEELVDGVKITALRAKHRYHTLDYLLSKRQAKLSKEKDQSLNAKLEAAEKIREEALIIVRNREANYRYDLKYLTTKRKGNTAYRFGYLYPVHDLHFWKREEKQYRGNHFSPFYKSIWNVWRIMGVIN